jgi:hypothetical protein
MTAKPQRFKGRVRYFRPALQSGLAVVDVQKEVAERGGLKQMRVRGVLNGVEFNSNTMLAGGGVLALSLSRKLLDAAGLNIGDVAEAVLERVPAAV